MKYSLKQVHYNNLTYFVEELCDDDIYDINNDTLVDHFNKDYIRQVLDYYLTGDLSFITKENFKDVFEIFFHYGSEIGLLLCYYNGNFKKDLDKLKYIDYDNKNYDQLENDYGKVVKFKRDFYNYGNREIYGKYFDWCIEEMKFDLDILDYDNYDIKVHKICGFDEINENYYRISFDYLFSQIIKKDMLPESLTHLTFDFIKLIKKDILPKSLEHLIFGTHYNQPIEKNSLPKSLKKLTFGNNFNQPIEKDSLPKSLTHLVFGRDFNQLIQKDSLSKSLTHLVFGRDFNQPIKQDILPESLKYLRFDLRFNQPIEKDYLPKLLECLEFGLRFNQPIKKDVLPKSLEYLRFGYNFNQPIEKDTIPESLNNLVFGLKFNQQIEKDVLPKSLTNLIFGFYFNQPIKQDILPKSLKYIKIKKGLLDESYLNDENLQVEYY
jgi:hypothetical protein